jgi:hypothetical protein
LLSASILSVDSADEVRGDIRALIFVDRQSKAFWITKRAARPVRNFEGAALRPPAPSVQRSDSAFKVLDTVNQNGSVPVEMSGAEGIT